MQTGLRMRANERNDSQHCWRNNVGSCCVRVGSGVQTDAATPDKFGTCGSNILALRFGDHGTKEMLGVIG